MILLEKRSRNSSHKGAQTCCIMLAHGMKLKVSAICSMLCNLVIKSSRNFQNLLPGFMHWICGNGPNRHGLAESLDWRHGWRLDGGWLTRRLTTWMEAGWELNRVISWKLVGSIAGNKDGNWLATPLAT